MLIEYLKCSKRLTLSKSFSPASAYCIARLRTMTNISEGVFLNC
jgi:hypothetical protein